MRLMKSLGKRGFSDGLGKYGGLNSGSITVRRENGNTHCTSSWEVQSDFSFQIRS